jgi:hypothetical protein
MYFLFPETKGRTLEEIGHLFGDDLHVAHNWYGASEEEKAKIELQALEDTKGGMVREKAVGDDILPVEVREDDRYADKGTAALSEDAGK